MEVPNFRAGGHQRGHQRGHRLARYPAGKAINVTRASVALGHPPVATGFIGEPEAEWYRQFLLEHHVENCRLIPVAGHTRENITVVDPQSPDADTHLVEQGFSVSSDDITRLRDELGLLCETGRLVAFCGSLPPGLSVERYVGLLTFCLDLGAELVIDSSGEALRAATELPLWLVKPNREELAELTGSEIRTQTQSRDAATDLARRVRWVLVSAGAEGAQLVDARGSCQAVLPLASKEVVGTVGCGDVLLGGFLAGWQGADRGEEAPPPGQFALRRGVAAATLAATRMMRAIDVASVTAMESGVRVDGAVGR